MKRFISLLLTVTLLLCGCGKQDEAPATQPTQATTAPTEAAPATQPTMETTSPVAAGHTMSSYAMEDFMLPLEEHSWEREYDPEFVMLHLTSAVVNNPRDLI